ncbi:MAG: hypothetical protein HUJ51_01585 [Eggerthellaceae bacterium]|nr:hypothetical protein [Eggerthellaceae bacterium]
MSLGSSILPLWSDATPELTPVPNSEPEPPPYEGWTILALPARIAALQTRIR